MSAPTYEEKMALLNEIADRFSRQSLVSAFKLSLRKAAARKEEIARAIIHDEEMFQTEITQ